MRTGKSPDEVDELPLWLSERMPAYWGIRDRVFKQNGQ